MIQGDEKLLANSEGHGMHLATFLCEECKVVRGDLIEKGHEDDGGRHAEYRDAWEHL